MNTTMKRIKRIISRFQRNLAQAGKGQSLVELMIIMPLLLLFFIGVFEVGWALRGYLVLVNANREITRFAVRPGYVDYSNVLLSTNLRQDIGYDDIASHLFTVLGTDLSNPTTTPGQLPVQFGVNSTLIVSHLVAETGFPCRDMSACDCSWFDDLNYRTNPNDTRFNTLMPGHKNNLMLLDDLIIHPGQPGKSFHTATYPVTSTVATRLNYPALSLELARQNDKFNCELLKKGGGAAPSANNVIITELFYDQPQLIGFPAISNAFTDPVPMYSQTTMRLTVGARGGNSDTVGPICDALPFIIKETDNPVVGQPIDILGGAGPSDYGWLAWNPNSSTGSNSSVALTDQLQYRRTAINDYTNVADSNDHQLSTGDWVASLPGMNASQLASSAAVLDGLVGQIVLVPMWSGNPADFQQFGSGSNKRDAYQISGFAKVLITSMPDQNVLSNTKNLMATYLGPATDCQ